MDIIKSIAAIVGHLDLAPLFYGILMFLGVWSMYSKLLNGNWLRLFIEIFVFTLVFVLHGGTMTGGFSAMIAALLAGLFLGRKTK